MLGTFFRVYRGVPNLSPRGTVFGKGGEGLYSASRGLAFGSLDRRGLAFGSLDLVFFKGF